MTEVIGGAAIPAAPLTLPAASPAQPEEARDEVAHLRELTTGALEALPDADVYVLVGAGPRGVHDSALASLDQLGVPDVEVELPVQEEVLEHLTRLVQYPMFRGDPLGVDLTMLALNLHAARGEVTVLPMSVPRGADFDVLVSVGASIGEAVEDAGVSAVVIVAGDLSAGLHEASPAHRIDGSRRFDERVVEAVRSGDLAELGALGPEEAERVQASGWAPLAVMHGVCASSGLSLEMLGYHAPRGVGQLVARCVRRARGEDRYAVRPPGEGSDGR